MTAARIALVALGTVVAAYGGYVLLTRQDGDNLVNAAVWLVAVVVVHDGVLVPATIAITVLGARLLPARWRRPATVALIIVAPLSLLAVPVLGRFGALPDDPGLLERPYLASWVAVVVVTSVVVVAVGWLHQRGGQEESDGSRTRR